MIPPSGVSAPGAQLSHAVPTGVSATPPEPKVRSRPPPASKRTITSRRCPDPLDDATTTSFPSGWRSTSTGTTRRPTLTRATPRLPKLGSSDPVELSAAA